MPEIDDTLNERGARYGDFTDHARIAQNLQVIMRATPGWERADHVQRQALTVIADKLARICNGDPNYDDNWRDIQGYAKLVEDRLPKAGIDLASAPDISAAFWRCSMCGKSISLPFSEHTCAPIDVLNNQATKQAISEDMNRARTAAGLAPKPYGAIHTDGSRSGGQPIEITDEDRNFVWKYPVRQNISFVQLMRGEYDNLPEIQAAAAFRRAAEKRGRQAQREDDAKDVETTTFEENCRP